MDKSSTAADVVDSRQPANGERSISGGSVPSTGIEPSPTSDRLNKIISGESAKGVDGGMSSAYNTSWPIQILPRQTAPNVIDSSSHHSGSTDNSSRASQVTTGPDGNNRSDPVGESVVDFLRAVSIPESNLSSNLPQTDGPISLIRKNQGYERLPSTSSPDESEDAVTNSFESQSNVPDPSTRVIDAPESSRNRDRASTVDNAASISAALPPLPLSPDSRRNAMYLGEGNSFGRPEPSSEVVVPRWQPDAEVTYCPICSTQFSFFVRKHHCRKCGRVVCNTCSPHRITIPYQFIVQAPNPESPNGEHRVTMVADRHGGTKVRLCNPCVPDPNTIPPQQQGPWTNEPPPTYTSATHGEQPYAMTAHALTIAEQDPRNFSGGPEEAPARTRGVSAARPGVPVLERRESQRSEPVARRFEHTLNVSGAGSSLPNNRMLPRLENSGGQNRSSMYTPTNASQTRGHISRHQSLSINSSGSTNTRQHHRSIHDPMTDRNNRPLPPIPRVAEEDECPICHRELPARTMPNFEDVRAAHVMECIEDQISAHSSRPWRPGAYTSASQPPSALVNNQQADPSPARQSHMPRQAQSGSPLTQPPATAQTSTSFTNVLIPANLRHLLPGGTAPATSSTPISTPAPAATAAPIANTPEARMRAREEAHAAVVLGHNSSPGGSASPRRTGMFPYVATEKDCVDDAECTICLEEFEVGVPMARLECLCRFHKHCIQDWFVGHPGRCPVHQHDGYGF